MSGGGSMSAGSCTGCGCPPYCGNGPSASLGTNQLGDIEITSTLSTALVAGIAAILFTWWFKNQRRDMLEEEASTGFVEFAEDDVAAGKLDLHKWIRIVGYKHCWFSVFYPPRHDKYDTSARALVLVSTFVLQLFIIFFSFECVCLR